MRATTVLATLILAFTAITSSACTPAQVRKFNEAMSVAMQDPAISRVIDDAAEWLVLNQLNTDLLSNLPLKDKQANATAGRWHLTKLEPKRVSEEIIQITYQGAGYSGDNGHNTGVTYVAKATVPYRIHVTVEPDYWYVQFIQEGQITDAYFQAQRVFREEYSVLFNIGAWLYWLFTGNTPTKEATKIGLDRMLTEFQKGFTVRVNKQLKHDIGLGIGHDAEYARKPFDSTGWARKEHYNERIKLWKQGRDFLGPIRLKAGSKLKIYAKTTSPVDIYLSENTPARQELVTHINPEYLADKDRPAIGAQLATTEWNAYYNAQQDITVWLIIDNTNQGKARPPEQPITAEVLIGTQ